MNGGPAPRALAQSACAAGVLGLLGFAGPGCRRPHAAVPSRSPVASATQAATGDDAGESTGEGSSLGGPPALRCTVDATFPSPWNVPEASAAAEVQLVPGRREILVVSDSGRKGAAVAWAPGSADPPRPLVLPLDPGASDDLEGMAWVPGRGGEESSGRLYTLTSSGAVQVYAPDGRGGLRPTEAMVRLGPPPLSCPDLHDINCGKNWEGLCLRARPEPARCAGYAASKA